MIFIFVVELFKY